MEDWTNRVLIHFLVWVLVAIMFSSCPAPIDVTGSQRLEDSTK